MGTDKSTELLFVPPAFGHHLEFLNPIPAPARPASAANLRSFEKERSSGARLPTPLVPALYARSGSVAKLRFSRGTATPLSRATSKRLSGESAANPLGFFTKSSRA